MPHEGSGFSADSGRVRDLHAEEFSADRGHVVEVEVQRIVLRHPTREGPGLTLEALEDGTFAVRLPDGTTRDLLAALSAHDD